MNELIGEAAALVARAAGASPVMTDVVRRMVPSMVDFARSRIADGGDPVAELDAMMAAGIEAARARAAAKFGV